MGETSVFSDFLGEMVGSICVPVCAVAFSCLQQAAEARTGRISKISER